VVWAPADRFVRWGPHEGAGALGQEPGGAPQPKPGNYTKGRLSPTRLNTIFLQKGHVSTPPAARGRPSAREDDRIGRLVAALRGDRFRVRCHKAM